VKNKTHCSLWVFDCDFQDALLILISLNKHETWFSFIRDFVSKFEGWKRRHFYGRLRAALSLAIHHWQTLLSLGQLVLLWGIREILSGNHFSHISASTLGLSYSNEIRSSTLHIPATLRSYMRSLEALDTVAIGALAWHAQKAPHWQQATIK